MQSNKLFFVLFFLLSIFGCSHSANQEHNNSKVEILNFYYDYLETIEGLMLEKKYGSYFSKKMSANLEESISPITNEALGFVMASTYMQKKHIKNSFIEDRSSESLPTCFSLIGKSFDGNPMFINFSLVREQQQWKISDFTRKAFIDGVEPAFPNKATCAEMTKG